MNLFSGNHALITGASAGLGMEFARQIHAHGAAVTLVARRADKLVAETERLNKIRPGSAITLPADLTDEGGIGKVLDYIRGNRIDILVNNAGRGSLGYFEELPIQSEVEQLTLNVTATLRLAHAVIPQMKARGMGALISVSSIAGFQPLPFMATYAATKAFNLYHSLALRQELRKFGIRVLTVCPGPTETEFFGAHASGVRISGPRRDRPEDVVAAALRALRRNEAIVVTGWRSRVFAFASRFFPLEISTRVAGKMLESAATGQRKGRSYGS